MRHGGFQYSARHVPFRFFLRVLVGSIDWRQGGRKIAGTIPLLFFLLNQYTLPYGLIIAPSTDTELEARPKLRTFMVKRQEASYLGHLIIEVPDPLPAGSLRPQIRVIDPDNLEIEAINRVLPGIKWAKKQILVSSSE